MSIQNNIPEILKIVNEAFPPATPMRPGIAGKTAQRIATQSKGAQNLGLELVKKYGGMIAGKLNSVVQKTEGKGLNSIEMNAVKTNPRQFVNAMKRIYGPGAKAEILKLAKFVRFAA